MRETIEKKIGCTIEEFLHKLQKAPVPPNEAEYPNPFSIFTYDERRYIDGVISEVYNV